VNDPIPQRYVRLCLRVGAHVDGFVDAYFGPASLEEALADGPHDPRELRDESLALLEEVARADLEDDRVRWLVGQLRGVECVTARLGGDEMTWSDEVERRFGIRPQRIDEDSFRASHGRLDETLPGRGDLRARYNAWLDATEVPAQRIPQLLDVFSAELQRRTSRIVELPPGEQVDYRSITGEVWEAFNSYRGELRSTVQVNVGFPISLTSLIAIAAHESYPGHHTERACKEQLLYRDGERFETCVTIAASPEAMITEGIATNALEVALADEGWAPLLDAAGDVGIEVDAATAEVVHVEGLVLWQAAANAARMLHEDSMAREDAESYMQEWALESPERARKSVNFISDPDVRTYVSAYTDGRPLCRNFIDRTPDGFRRLLTEQLTVSSLLDAGT
jgi:hypothetical protein